MRPTGNFIFIPGPDFVHGELHLLGECSGNCRPGCFVVIPYSEPKVKLPQVKYYEILRSSLVVDFLDRSTETQLVVKAETSQQEYLEKVQVLKEHIQRGNIYEINFCIKFSASGAIDPFSLFLRLCEVSRAPYLMMARIDDDYLLCASPELFLQKKGNTLITKPIKGTIRRGKDQQEDEMLKNRLFNSQKDRTENVMAVDVARNDLSRVAARGSVAVNKLYNIETFATVHQMVSTVSCELRPNVDLEEIIRATFPMASMTGAPKESAMRLIGEKEHFDRNFYSGTMGIIDRNGDFELPVLIRSVFYNDKSKQLWFATGSAITYLSDPEEEYRECLLKAGTMLKALNAELLKQG